jgi:hypothetical protein
VFAKYTKMTETPCSGKSCLSLTCVTVTAVGEKGIYGCPLVYKSGWIKSGFGWI